MIYKINTLSKALFFPFLSSSDLTSIASLKQRQGKWEATWTACGIHLQQQGAVVEWDKWSLYDKI